MPTLSEIYRRGQKGQTFTGAQFWQGTVEGALHSG